MEKHQHSQSINNQSGYATLLHTNYDSFQNQQAFQIVSSYDFYANEESEPPQVLKERSLNEKQQPSVIKSKIPKVPVQKENQYSNYVKTEHCEQREQSYSNISNLENKSIDFASEEKGSKNMNSKIGGEDFQTLVQNFRQYLLKKPSIPEKEAQSHSPIAKNYPHSVLNYGKKSPLISQKQAAVAKQEENPVEIRFQNFISKEREIVSKMKCHRQTQSQQVFLNQTYNCEEIDSLEKENTPDQIYSKQRKLSYNAIINNFNQSSLVNNQLQLVKQQEQQTKNKSPSFQLTSEHFPPQKDQFCQIIENQAKKASVKRTEELYEMSRIQKQKLENMREEQQNKQMEVCTFQPKIHKVSQKNDTQSKEDFFLRNAQWQKEQERNMREAREQRETLILQEFEKSCTFKPTIKQNCNANSSIRKENPTHHQKSESISGQYSYTLEASLQQSQIIQEPSPIPSRKQSGANTKEFNYPEIPGQRAGNQDVKKMIKQKILQLNIEV